MTIRAKITRQRPRLVFYKKISTERVFFRQVLNAEAAFIDPI